MAATAANSSDGFEWRALLGPTHDWRVPELELRTEQSGVEERCELCGEPIDQSKPFVTNSAGKQPMHLVSSRGATSRRRTATTATSAQNLGASAASFVSG
jgi:hypothetical protein